VLVQPGRRVGTVLMKKRWRSPRASFVRAAPYMAPPGDDAESDARQHPVAGGLPDVLGQVQQVVREQATISSWVGLR